MQMIELGNMLTIIVNMLMWGIIHIAISFITLIMPEERFRKNSGLYQIRSWEQDGKFWANYFKIKRWKHVVPDGAKLFKKGFQKKRAADTGYSLSGDIYQGITKSRVDTLAVYSPSSFLFL
ncbi:hypothetical protein MUN88_00670 [Gracilibacillus caseinilyticus]|uniref:Glycosyl-4,4'-diaponeurosporenoate acyltransferase n=1 Tax=Gracilibacillus caseinilyticus TaxID=2932256 RepID=A0ABY4EXL7_9BACI|nr:hypothetical protein [Gracilibacillus caseinilyticus]UOQ48710.1 hypothetical protein MUN88_00670 [Gracilibacillus caseinilyticus]